MLTSSFIYNFQLIIMFSSQLVSLPWLKCVVDLTHPAIVAPACSVIAALLIELPSIVPVIFLLGLVCVCASVRESALQEAISGFKYAELLTQSCIYCLRALATMDMAMGHLYSILLSVSGHGCV